MQIQVKVEDREVREGLRELRRRGANLRPVMLEIGEIVRTSVERNFAAGGRPERWEKSGRVKKSGGQTLSDTGRLRRSFTVEAGNDRVAVGTNVIYAAIHHFGGKTPARVITAKNGKALFWPGARHPVRSVNHPGSRIPARPFLTAQDEDWPRIRTAIGRHLLER